MDTEDGPNLYERLSRRNPSEVRRGTNIPLQSLPGFPPGSDSALSYLVALHRRCRFGMDRQRVTFRIDESEISDLTFVGGFVFARSDMEVVGVGGTTERNCPSVYRGESEYGGLAARDSDD